MSPRRPTCGRRTSRRRRRVSCSPSSSGRCSPWWPVPTLKWRRDAAILRLILDSGIRRAEIAGLRVGDVDFDHKFVVVLGKGSRPRAVPFGRKTAQAIDRYLRVRGRHHHAGSGWLWNRQAGQAQRLGYCSGRQASSGQAGVKVHPHLFRHTWARSPMVCRRATSRAWQGGAADKWSAATAHQPPMSAPAAHTSATAPVTGCDPGAARHPVRCCCGLPMSARSGQLSTPDRISRKAVDGMLVAFQPSRA